VGRRLCYTGRDGCRVVRSRLRHVAGVARVVARVAAESRLGQGIAEVTFPAGGLRCRSSLACPCPLPPPKPCGELACRAAALEAASGGNLLELLLPGRGVQPGHPGSVELVKLAAGRQRQRDRGAHPGDDVPARVQDRGDQLMAGKILSK
jgi:hypothetical protein